MKILSLKKFGAIASFAFVALLFVSLANVTDTQAVQSSMKKPSNTATTELQWVKTPFGAEASPVSGDFSKGRHITMLKFPPGAKTPLHKHSNEYVGIVISGNMKHWLPGKPETEEQLTAGSHWFMPANTEHISECLPGVECVMALIQEDKFDFVPSSQK